MNDPLTRSDIKSALSQIAKNEGFQNYEIVKGYSVAFGEGFVGTLFKVKLQEIDDEKELNLMVKCLPDDPFVENDFQGFDKFEREIHIYREVLPKFVDMQKTCEIPESEGFFDFPKCYFADMTPRPLIVMEDLSADNYKCLGRSEVMDYEHCKLVLASLAKLHALSLTLKQKYSSFFDEFKIRPDIQITQLTKTDFKYLIWKEFDQTMKLLNEDESEKKDKISEIQDDFEQFMLDLTDYEAAEPFSVITHADCWSNNFMFKYSDTSPSNVILLDWQMTRYASPVLDLLFFLFMNTDHETRLKHFEDLSNQYHNSFEKFLIKLGGIAKFTKQDFEKQMKTFGLFGFVIAVFLVPLVTREEENLLEPDKFFEMLRHPEDNKELLEEHFKIHKPYADRMRGCIDDAFRLGFL